MIENPAKPTDLADLGHTLAKGTTVARARLDQVWRALQSELRQRGTSVEAILAAGVTADDLRDVVVNATARVLDNPEGLTDESEAIDDYRYARKRANATTDIYFTAAELRRLIPAWITAPSAGSLRYTR